MLATNGSNTIYFENNLRLQTSLEDKAPIDVPLQKGSGQVFYQNITGDDKHDPRSEGQKDFRNTSSIEPGIPFQNVFSEKIRRWNETNFRPSSTQCTYSHKTFSPYFSGRCSRFLAGSGLVGEDRPPECVLSCTYSRGSQKVSESHLQSGNTAVNSSTFWPLFGTTDFLSNVKLGCGNPTCQRCSNAGISGRLLVGSSKSVQPSHSGCGNAEVARDFRMACQLSKVRCRSYAGAGIFRHNLEYSQKHHSITTEKSSKNKRHFIKDRSNKNINSKGCAKSFGPSKFCVNDRPRRTPSLPQNATVSERFSQRSSKGEESSVSACPAGSSMVAKSSRPCYQTVTPKASHTLLNHRRSGCRVGRSAKRVVSVRNVDLHSEQVALQRQGDVRSVWYNLRPTRQFERSPHSDTVRQQNTGSVRQERRRHSLSGPPKPNHETSRVDRSARNNTDGKVPTRKTKRDCRPSIQRSSTSRVAPVAPGHGGHIQRMGRTRYRFVRFGGISSRTKICHSRLDRWVRNFLRRLQSSLGLSVGMGVPTSQPDPAGSGSPECIQRDIHSNSSPMATMLLATRSPGQGFDKPSTDKGSAEDLGRFDNGAEPSTSRQTFSPSLENWGWKAQIAHWATGEKALLKQSWRESTLLTYKAPIKRWISWCETNNINPSTPTGNDVARFLAKLFLEDRLAYRTILLHKSAVSTFCATSAEDIAKNFFVHQILKAISLAKPNIQRAQVFDIKLLFDWLLSTPVVDTLFNISRRTALILLLASGRRVHDLTLLDMSEDNLIDEEDQLTLWPRFGSKTDSNSHRQSGWALIRHHDENICPVTHIRRLIQLSRERRSQTQINSLFISCTGIVKPASRTNIGNWIRTILREVGIDAAPGSIRSAVSSRSWFENRPIDEILERANWRCAETFRKHYCREVQTSLDTSGADLLYNNFKSV